jgi:hypothetical protein
VAVLVGPSKRRISSMAPGSSDRSVRRDAVAPGVRISARAPLAHFRDALSGVEFDLPADVVVASGNRVRDNLSAALRNPRVLAAGDAVAPRTITEAVREGRLVARAL